LINASCHKSGYKLTQKCGGTITWSDTLHCEKTNFYEQLVKFVRASVPYSAAAMHHDHYVMMIKQLAVYCTKGAFDK